MKATIYITLFCMVVTPCFSQTRVQMKNLESNLKELFLGFDVESKPEKIENEYIPIKCYTPGAKAPDPEKNAVHFKTHSLISGLKSGSFHVNYLYRKELYDEYGLYQLRLQLSFTKLEECINQYNKLIAMFELFGEIKVETTTKSIPDRTVIIGKNTVFKESFYAEMPRLSIRYSHSDNDDSGYMEIMFYKSWKNEYPGGTSFFSE